MVPTTIVVDSFAWIEYADGSQAGDIAREYIEGSSSLITPAIVVAELSDKATRTGRRDDWTERLLPFIRRQTTIAPLTPDLADRAGELKWSLREASPEVGLADALVLATAREAEAMVLTGDPDFLVDELADEVIDCTMGESS